MRKPRNGSESMAHEDELKTRITAQDDASKVLDAVATKADKLEGTDANVKVTADDRASAQIDDIITKTASLDKDTATVILNAETKRAESEVKGLQLLLAKVEGDEATVILEARDQASARLDKLKAAMRDVEAQSPVEVDAKAGPGLTNVGELLGKLPGQMGEVAGKLGSLGSLSTGGAIAGGVTAIAGGLLAAAEHAADLAINASDLASYIGTSVEDASRLLTVMGSVGIESGDLKDIIGQVNGVLTDTPELAKQLGIELANASPAEVFKQAYEAIRKIEDPQKRLILMGKAFGEEGARQIGSLIARYGDLSEAIEDVPESMVASPEDAQAARDFKASLQEVTREFQGMAIELGSSVLPLLVQLVGLFDKVSHGALGGVPIPHQDVQDWVIAHKKAIEELGFAYSDWQADAALGAVTIDDLQEKLDGATAKLDTMDRETRKLAGVMGEAAESGVKLAKETEHVGLEAQDAANPVKSLTTRIDEQRDAFDKLMGRYNKRDEFLTVQENFNALRETIEANKKATDENRISNEAFEQQVIAAKGAVITYIQTMEGIEPEVKTRIQAEVDQGSVEHAEAVLRALEKARTTTLFIEPKLKNPIPGQPKPDGGTFAAPTAGATLLAAELGAPTPVTTAAVPAMARVVPVGRPVATTVINVTVPRGYREIDAATAAHRLARRSGRLYAGRR